jgi:hypothetical protein
MLPLWQREGRMVQPLTTVVMEPEKKEDSLALGGRALGTYQEFSLTGIKAS